jgi:Fe2+ transport system protein B
VTKNSLENGSYDLLVQVIDIKQKKRALNLTIELMKFNIPILLVFNKKKNICTHNKLISEIKKKL